MTFCVYIQLPIMSANIPIGTFTNDPFNSNDHRQENYCKRKVYDLFVSFPSLAM